MINNGKKAKPDQIKEIEYALEPIVHANPIRIFNKM